MAKYRIIKFEDKFDKGHFCYQLQNIDASNLWVCIDTYSSFNEALEHLKELKNEEQGYEILHEEEF